MEKGGIMMKKFFNRVMAASTCAVMVAGSLAGCGSTAAPAASSAAPAAASTQAAASTAAASTQAAASTAAASTAAAANSIDNKDIKIGVSIWSSTDVLGSQCKKILDEAAKSLGVQVQYVDQGHVSEKVTASVEQLAAAGCQGIIICNSSDTEMTSAIKTCNDNKVYLAQFFRIISKDNSADIYKMAEESPYYIGAVHENEPENGEKLVNILLEKGKRDIGLIGWEQGDATWLGRWEGYKAGVEKWNKAHPDDQAKLSEPQYAGTSSEGGSKAAEALMSADPKLDALIPAGGGGDPLQGAIAAVERAGKTKDIAIVSTDFLPDLGDRLANGSMAGESGGHYCDPLFAFMMVYNAIKGNYSGFEGKFEDVQFPYLYVSSADDYKSYEKYFVDQLPYTDDELVAMSKLDMNGLKQAASSLSIEDAASRAGK
jgi:ABC-type sugar transport system substrate-binding protein